MDLLIILSLKLGTIKESKLKNGESQLVISVFSFPGKKINNLQPLLIIGIHMVIGVTMIIVKMYKEAQPARFY